DEYETQWENHWAETIRLLYTSESGQSLNSNTTFLEQVFEEFSFMLNFTESLISYLLFYQAIIAMEKESVL
ncbi:MAG: hypothetical protein AAGA86_12140, partial [Bacteroidota bacterium]